MRVNEAAVTVTGSVKLTTMVELARTPAAPLVGVVVVTAGGASVVKLKTWFAAIVSGGSSRSLSVTCAANTVAVHTSLTAKSVFGSMVKVIGPPPTTELATVRVPLAAHAISNQEPVTVTGSLKVMVTFD